jgi:hypothetical protein
MFNKIESLYDMIKKFVIIVITPPKPSNSTEPLTEPLIKN